MTKTNARRAVRRYIADRLRNNPRYILPETIAVDVLREWDAEVTRIADRIERGDLVQGHRLRLE